MTDTHITLPDNMPTRMRQLPRDDVGRPIPWFVPIVDGKHDFRFTDVAKIVTAWKEELCFVCGRKLTRARHPATVPRGTFVAGPMCVINRTSAEPPSHADCAEWSAKACPFMVRPGKIRRDTNMPDEVMEPAGIMIERNPGVAALIDSERWMAYKVPDGHGGQGILFSFDRIVGIRWMTGGRNASAAEVLTSIDTGIHALAEVAEQEHGAMRALASKTRNAIRWIPGEFKRADYPNVARVLEHL